MVSSDGIGRGLCDRCIHQRLIGNTRGSSFSLCQLSRLDDAFVKYPPVPVLRCEGFEPRGTLANPSSRPT